MKIDSFSLIQGKPSMVARFNLVLDSGFIIRDIRLMRSQSGANWLAWPSRSYKDKEGKDKYFDYITFDKEKREAIEKVIREKAEAFLAPSVKEPRYDDPPF